MPYLHGDVYTMMVAVYVPAVQSHMPEYVSFAPRSTKPKSSPTHYTHYPIALYFCCETGLHRVLLHPSALTAQVLHLTSYTNSDDVCLFGTFEEADNSDSALRRQYAATQTLMQV